MSDFYALVGSAECRGIQILTIIRYFNSLVFWGHPVVWQQSSVNMLIVIYHGFSH
jgi:hypothetical protein